MAKVAVTGYTGFIGQHLIEGLLKAGHIVHPVGKNFAPISCDIVYHLACPSTTEKINNDPLMVMDTILDVTRKALQICPTALFVNASSMGAEYIDNTAQGAYNVAKRCMELYIHHSNVRYKNYRLPSVYGEKAHDDSYIKRCVNGKAYYPNDPDKIHYIAHIDDVVEALVNLTDVEIEQTTLGKIYEQFAIGGRGLHRPALGTQTSKN